MQKNQYPILMADVIKSGDQDGKKIIAQLKQLIDQTTALRKKSIISPLTITLGDEFQGIVDTVESGIETILDMEELIIHSNLDIRLRYILSYGTIDTVINTKKAYEMLGEGLTEAREKLLAIKATDFRFFINIPQYPRIDETLLNKAFILYQYFKDDWKKGDYKIVSAFLRYVDYKIVSEKVSLNISSAWRREKSLNIKQYQTVKSMIYDIIHSQN